MFTLVRKANQRHQERRNHTPSGSRRPSKDLAPPTPPMAPSAARPRPSQSAESRAASRHSLYRDDDADRGHALHRASTAGSKMSAKAAALLGMHDAAPPVPSALPSPPLQAPPSHAPPPPPASSARTPKAWFRLAQRNLRARPSQETLASLDSRNQSPSRLAPPAPAPLPEKSRPNISPPSNFQHLTHTRPHHFTRMSTKSANDLLADFSAVRAGQTPAKAVQGMRTCSIRLRVSHSRDSSTDAKPDSLRPEEGKLNCLRAPSLRSTSTRNSFNGFDKDARPNAIPQDGQYKDPATGIVHHVWTDDRSINLRSSRHDEFASMQAMSTANDIAGSIMNPSTALPAVTEELDETIASSRASSIARASRHLAPSVRSGSSLASSQHLWSPRKSSLPSWTKRIRRLHDDQVSDNARAPSESERSDTLPTPTQATGFQFGRGTLASDEPSNISRLPSARSRMSFGGAQPVSSRNSMYEAKLEPYEPATRDLRPNQLRIPGDETIADIDDWLASEFAGHNIKYQPSCKRRSTANTPSGSPRTPTFGNNLPLPSSDARSASPPRDNHEVAPAALSHDPQRPSALRRRRSNQQKKVSFGGDAPAPLTIRKTSAPSSCQALTPTSATTSAASTPLLTPVRSPYPPPSKLPYPPSGLPKLEPNLSGPTCASHVVDYHRPALAHDLPNYPAATPQFY